MMQGGICLAAHCGQRQAGEGMTDELGVDATGAVERTFEGEDDKHLGNPLLHPAEAASFPRPELRTDQVDHGNVKALQLAGEAKVDVREVDENGNRGSLPPDSADELAELGVDIGCVTEHFGNAHVGNVLGADDTPLASLFHLPAAETEESCLGKGRLQRLNQLRAVVVPRGLSGGEEDMRIGRRHDGNSLACCRSYRSGKLGR